MIVSGPKKYLRFQFSIRSLLVCVLLLALPIGCVSILAVKAKRQRAAVSSLRASNVVVRYDSGMSADRDLGTTVANCLQRHFGPDFVSRVATVRYPPGNLPRCRLAPVRAFWGPRNLLLSGTSLRDSDVSPHGMQHVETLDASYTDVTDALIRELATHSTLRDLDVSGTAVTNASHEYLAGIPLLRRVVLRDTRVSSRAVESLRAARPMLDVVWSEFKGEEHIEAIRSLSRLGALVEYTQEADLFFEVGVINASGYRVGLFGDGSDWYRWRGTDADVSQMSRIRS